MATESHFGLLYTFISSLGLLRGVSSGRPNVIHPQAICCSAKGWLLAYGLIFSLGEFYSFLVWVVENTRKSMCRSRFTRPLVRGNTMRSRSMACDEVTLTVCILLCCFLVDVLS